MGDPSTQCLPPVGIEGCNEAEVDSGETPSAGVSVVQRGTPLPILTAGVSLNLDLFPAPIQSLFATTAAPAIDHLRKVAPSAPHREPRALRVMTVNAYLYETEGWKWIFFETPDTRRRVRKLAAFIAREKPDVVLLQEVWQKKWFDLLVTSLIDEGYFNDELSEGKTRDEIISRYTVFFSALGHGNTDLGVVGRHPLSNPDFKPFIWQGSESTECGRRLANEEFVSGLGMVHLNVDGQSLLLANIHPMHRREDEEGYQDHRAELSEERATQLLEAWAMLAPELGRQPVIFAGDFNFNLSYWEYTDVFKPLFGLSVSDDLLGPSSPTAGLCTFCASSPFHPGINEGILDHIFVNNGLLMRGAAILTPRPAFSDHEIVVAEVALRKERDISSTRTDFPDGSRAPVKSHLKRVPLPAALIESLISYFEAVSFHPYCLFTDFDDERAANAIDFLAQLETAPPERRETLIAQPLSTRPPSHERALEPFSPGILTSTSLGH